MEDMRVALAATITKLNFGELEDLIGFAKELGCDCFYAFNFIPTGRGRDIIDLDLSPLEREEMLRILFAHMQSDGIAIITSAAQLARYCVAQGSDAAVVNTGHYGHGRGGAARLLSEYVGGCGAGRVYCAIQPNGVVTPCVFMPLPVGNILTDNFSTLWETHPVLELLRDREQRQGHCRVCEYRYYCGGCRARPYGYYGDLTMPDPGCIFNQDAWDKLQRGVPADAMEPAAG
jgi:radical SAM protein with 4Fe4S-binding SPASM domain